MKKKSDDAADPDPWKEKLLESLKQERPSPRRWGIWLSIGMLGLLALVAWFMYPGPTLPMPPLVTFDVVVPAGEEAPVRAVFEMPPEGEPVAKLAGRQFHFSESRLPLGKELSAAQVVLKKDGVAEATLTVPAEMRQVAFEAQCPGGSGLPGVKDQARIFNLPADAKLAVVTVEGTLSLSGVGDWEKTNHREVVGVPEAAPALQAARKHGYEIVYLALESARPTTYQKLRSWARFRFGADAAKLPEGPVLGRPEYPGDFDSAYLKSLTSLKERFTGPHVGITASPTLARRFKEAGYRTVLVGDGEPIANIERLRGWEELAGMLKKK